MIKLSNHSILNFSAYLIGIFLVIETISGIFANSLTLLADAGHTLSDFFAILLSLIAQKYVKKPIDCSHSYGYSRMQIIASFVNGITLVCVSIIVTSTAVIRLFNATPVNGFMMLVTSVVGTIVNGLILYVLHLSEDKNLNIKSAILHVFSDLIGFISAFFGAILIEYTNFFIIDPILSIFISLLVFNSALKLIRESMHILMEGAPNDVKESDIKLSLKKINGVLDVHHIHIWLLNDQYKIITLHLVLQNDANPFITSSEAQIILRDLYAIKHATIAVERYDEYLNVDYNHH